MTNKATARNNLKAAQEIKAAFECEIRPILADCALLDGEAQAAAEAKYEAMRERGEAIARAVAEAAEVFYNATGEGEATAESVAALFNAECEHVYALIANNNREEFFFMPYTGKQLAALAAAGRITYRAGSHTDLGQGFYAALPKPARKLGLRAIIETLRANPLTNAEFERLCNIAACTGGFVFDPAKDARLLALGLVEDFDDAYNEAGEIAGFSLAATEMHYRHGYLAANGNFAWCYIDANGAKRDPVREEIARQRARMA